MDYGSWVKVTNPSNGLSLHIRKEYVLSWTWDGEHLVIAYLGLAGQVNYGGALADAIHKAFLNSDM